MTTKIKIKNDSRIAEGFDRPHDIKVETIDKGVITNVVYLLPEQEASELHVWEGRSYLITEMPKAAAI
jgi:hypothetical protein